MNNHHDTRTQRTHLYEPPISCFTFARIICTLHPGAPYVCSHHSSCLKKVHYHRASNNKNNHAGSTGRPKRCGLHADPTLGGGGQCRTA